MSDVIPFSTTIRTLDNGLGVIVMPMPTDGLAAFWTIVRTGSRDEYGGRLMEDEASVPFGLVFDPEEMAAALHIPLEAVTVEANTFGGSFT